MDMPAPQPMPSPPAPAEPKRVSRKGLYIPLMILGLIILGWSGAWLFAKSKAAELMDAGMEREARLGRQWTCPNRDIGGFPFRIDLTCDAPTFVSTQPGREGKGAVARLAVTARVLDPKQIIAVLTSPATFTTAAGETIDLQFDDARASYKGTPQLLEQASVELRKPALTFTAPGYEPLKIAAGTTEFHVRSAPDVATATDLALSAEDIRSDILNTLASDPSPARLTFRTRLEQFAPALARDWRETLETWRQADGVAKIGALTIDKGPIALNVTGQVRLDSQRRPEGEITGTAAGVNQMLKVFGIDLGGAAELLGSLLGSKPAQGSGKALPFALRMDNGRLFVGRIPGPRLRPLYSY